MNIQEMATAVTQGTGITICLLNNNYLGMIRQMQELFYGKRYSATCLRRRPSCPGGWDQMIGVRNMFRIS